MEVHSSSNGVMDGLHPQTVLSRLSEQRSHGLFCDVTIVVEDIKFRAHRNVLAATSGYFRKALTTSGTCPSGQVLEIPDLKSEVFATILNFIYSSRVDSVGTEEHKSLVAAGKRLGIPFLEKLLETNMVRTQPFAKSESSTSQTKLTGPWGFKNEQQRVEEQDCSKGPRIMNAFSFTEVPEVSNPFTLMDLHTNAEQSSDPGPQQAPGAPPLEGDSVDAVFEHSYAVSKEHHTADLKEGSQLSDKTTTKPELGPIKKRHRLCKALAPAQNETSATVQNPAVQNGPPDSTSSDLTTDLNSAPELMSPPEISPLPEAEPPALIPEDVPTSTTYRCQQCPEAFSSSALLTIHKQIHKRRFVSHLFCKFCNKKFIHLKRLRNHEQVCLKGPPELEPNDKQDTDSLDQPSAGDTLTSPDVQDPPELDHTLTSTSEEPQEVFTKPRGRQRAYKCSMCKRAYVTLSSLKRHENVHSWQRAYPCHYCNKVFALAEYRTKHEIWHTGERRYQCIFCLETFLTYYILRNHQKSFHGIDPRLTVNKKTGNGGFKGSIYPIKLYRLLPMKFRKKRYKTYNETCSEVLGKPEHAPLNTSDVPHKGNKNSESVNIGQSLFSMPVTFMATPKLMATEVPLINRSAEIPLTSDENLPHGRRKGFQTQKNAQLTGFEGTGSPFLINKYTSLTTEENSSLRASIRDPKYDAASKQVSSETNRDVLPFLNLPPVCSFEGLSKLNELSAAAQTIEAMANQLLKPPPGSHVQDLPPDKQTETYIAKPACPGPSVDNQVLPLCQITVKIGNEAIIRRKIKGSKLFPKKKKRRTWEDGQTNHVEDGAGFPNLRLRTEVTSSVTEDEPYEDVNDPENDKPWRPYYSYKPKKRGKRLRSRQKRIKGDNYYTKPLSPEPEGDFTKREETETRVELRGPKEDFMCRRCSRSFSSPTSLSMHIISCHQPRCKICSKLCPVDELPNSDTSFMGDFICQSCTEDGSCFSSDTTSRTMSSEKRYRCSYCPQRFLYLATKKSHEAKHLDKFGGTLEHSCRYCSKVCKSAAQLSIHEGKHATKIRETEKSDVNTDTRARSPLPEIRHQMKPEPWESFKKTEKPLEKDYPKIKNIHKKMSSSFSSEANRTLSPFLPDLLRRKNKKKNRLNLYKNFSPGSEAQEQSLLTSAPSNLLSIPYPVCLARLPAAKESSLHAHRSEWSSFKEEPVFPSDD
ncbi:zinc finger and BTB domain-containing protein 38 [Trichomycterus rosablanca]|uniref:zinc finger and BTB domain-containing protein 38 n=1 Tax=Trichomycterus rosablanca TaxID=2290929 RepID=UPI002F35A7DA